uniref:Uncharacterized mitochondrial protein AtMg00810-like n=1 Tax=Tanacetum cinerariifolium TaxID=118510 RepID=A0A6L2L9B1_TANCI|nr:uncharacterized mitochondrial protein AtMg00810-like [Tanacetum cinerariifolium]
MSSMGELTFFLRLQVKQQEDGIFISQDKYVAEILKKFDFLSVNTASTPIETKKPLVKDEEAVDVDVTPKTSHLQAVKRTFRYLKGQPKLGLWYPRESTFDLKAYSDSDYVGANLDRKSTTGGSFKCWLITTPQMVINSPCLTNKKELAISGQTTTGKELSNSLMAGSLPKTTLPTNCQLKVNVVRLKLTTVRVYAAEGLAKMGYEKTSDKLTFYKAFFSPQWKFLIHTILQCLSAKTTSWNEFNSTMASAIICLPTNQKFNFSRYILLSLVKNIEVGVPFFMFPRFVQLLINHQLGDMAHHKEIFDTPLLTKKVFSNMKMVGTRFFREVTPLFNNMLVQALEEVGILQANAQSIPITTEPSTYKSQNKHKPKRKHTQESNVPLTKYPTAQNLPSPSNDPLPSGEDSLKLKELMNFCTNLSNKVLELESEVIDIKSTYQERIEKLERRVERLEEENRMLKELKNIDVDVEINLEKAQAEGYNLDLDHQEKVLSMIDVNEEEPADVEEVLKVVKAAKLMTEVVTTTGATKVSVLRKRRGVIIQDPQETTTTANVQPKVQAKDKGKAILIKEPKPLKTQAQIELDEEVARQLEVELNADINWNVVIEQVKRVKVSEIEVRQEKDVEVESSKREDATPLASKIPIVDYKIQTKRNKPYFKIIRADGNHIDRFEKTKLKNYSDDYLLNTLKIMFEKPNVEASVWKDQKGRYGLAKDESEMSLELLRLVIKQLNEGGGLLGIMDFYKLLLLVQLSVADEDLVLLLEITAGEEEKRRHY